MHRIILLIDINWPYGALVSFPFKARPIREFCCATRLHAVGSCAKINYASCGLTSKMEMEPQIDFLTGL